MMRLKVCWILFTTWMVLFLVSMIWPQSNLQLSAILLPIIMLLHGSILYGWKGIGAYVLIGVTVGFLLEASSVANGFPFGSYVHNVAGPKPAGVPIQAIAGYTLIGWFAWTIGKIVALDNPERPQPYSRVTVPLIAAFILAGFDLPYDPVGATVHGQWTYAHPSGQFGVPLTNFLGWIFTGWVLFQLFVLVESRFAQTAASSKRNFWLLPCLFWLGMALQFPFLWLRAAPGIVTLGKRTYVIADVYEGAVITSLFTIVAIALIALARLYSPRKLTQG